MIVRNKVTGKDVTSLYLKLLKGEITKKEFELQAEIGNMMLKSLCEITNQE